MCFVGADTTLEDVGGIEHEHPPPCARWPGALGSWSAGHYPWVWVWAGACYWHGVGGFMFNSSSSSSSSSNSQLDSQLGRKTRSAFFTPIPAGAFFTRSLRVFYNDFLRAFYLPILCIFRSDPPPRFYRVCNAILTSSPVKLRIRIGFIKRRSRVLQRRTRQAALDKPRVHDEQLGFCYTKALKSVTAKNRSFEEKQPLGAVLPSEGTVARAHTPAAFRSMDYHVHSTWIGSCNIDLDPAICGGGRRPRSTADGIRRP